MAKFVSSWSVVTVTPCKCGKKIWCLDCKGLAGWQCYRVANASHTIGQCRGCNSWKVIPDRKAIYRAHCIAPRIVLAVFIDIPGSKEPLGKQYGACGVMAQLRPYII